MYHKTAKFYGFFYDGGNDASRRCEFISSFLGKEAARIIEISAGVGDLAFRLAGRGHYVTCLEESDPVYAVLLDRYKANKAIRHLVSLFPVNISDFPILLDADMAVASNVFSHLEETEKQSLITHVHSQLGREGKFIFNCVQSTPARPEQPFSEIHKKVFGEMVIRHFASSRPLDHTSKQRVRFEYRMEFQGRPVKSVSEEFTLHMDTPESMTKTLHAAGFSDVRTFGGYEGTPCEPGLPGFVVVARKSQ